MTWNYRVVATTDKDGEVTLGVHEAYYERPEDTIPNGITEEPVAAVGGSLEELKEVMRRQRTAYTFPVLTLEDGKIVEYHNAEIDSFLKDL